MKIEFLFDFISPYAYLAWWHLPRLVAAEVEPVPVLLASLLNANKQLGPAEIPSKRLYTFRNVLRLAYDYGVPLNPPASHPFNPLLPLRLCCLPMTVEQRRSLVSRIFLATWRDGVDVTRPEAMAEVVPELSLEEALSPENKERLRVLSESALARGVFGVPTFMVEEELFWGCDAMPHLAAYLRGEDAARGACDRGWSEVRPSATRAPS